MKHGPTNRRMGPAEVVKEVLAELKPTNSRAFCNVYAFCRDSVSHIAWKVKYGNYEVKLRAGDSSALSRRHHNLGQAGHSPGLLIQYNGREERKGWKSLDTKIALDYICTIICCFPQCVCGSLQPPYIRGFSCSAFRCSFSLLVPVWGWYKGR